MIKNTIVENIKCVQIYIYDFLDCTILHTHARTHARTHSCELYIIIPY